ncbi:MAG: acyl-CoA dehydrogenase family protein [Deltaproteobacteria bacterium]|nr:acyl-CoA dehydrogenase family protein [Deltaproteobacteria bacterium]
MIDFELNDEQKAWQKKSRDFAEREIKPLSLKLDRDPSHDFNWDIVRRLAKEDLLFLSIPKEYGGSGLDPVTIALIIEELAVGDAGVAFTTTTNLFQPIQTDGNEEQKGRYLPLICDRGNPGLLSFVITEPGAGSDAAAITTSAQLRGDEYLIRGTKCFITNGGLARVYTIFANADRTKGAKGISAFIVPGDSPGLSRGKVEDKMGLRSSCTAEVILDDVRIPKENLLGEIGSGFRIAMRYLDVARTTSCAAVALGLARAALETAMGFFKRSPEKAKATIGQQIISHSLADMAAALESSRLLVWKAAWMLGKKLPVSKDSALAKFLASDMCLKVTADALQLLGFHGYTPEYPLEKYLRDAKILQIYEGTNQIQRTVASRELLAN